MAAAFLLTAAGCAESGDDAKSAPGFEIPAGDTITTATETCIGCHDEAGGVVPITGGHPAAAVNTGNTPTINSVNITLQAEVTDVTFFADGADSLDGTWFSLYSAGDLQQYYVWFDTGAGAGDPGATGIGLQVSISTDDTAATISGLAQVVIDGNADFTAVDNTGSITITNAGNGLTTDAADGTAATGFNFMVTTKGGDAVTVVVYVDDGSAVIGLSDSDIRFTFAQLVPGTSGDSDDWVSYINNSSGVATYERANTSWTFVDNADGTYDYTLDKTYDLVGDTDTHRIGMQVSSGIANDWFDFVPVAGGQTTVANPREIVVNASCNKCHGEEGSAATGGGLAMHGSTRVQLEYCVTCHNPGSYDTDTNNTVDFKVMIHKIHSGKELPSVQAGGSYQIIGYGGSVHDWSGGGFPQPITNCQKCHDNGVAADADNWMNVPTMEACTSCHDTTSFVSPAPSGTTLHSGGAQADNSACSGCHPATSLTDIKAVSNAHSWSQILAQGLAYTYVIDSVSYSPTLPLVAGITSSGTTATITFVTAHNMLDGAEITVKGAFETGYNVKARVSNVSTFAADYTIVASSSPATGPLEASRTSREVQVQFRVDNGGDMDLAADAEWTPASGNSKLNINIGWRDGADYTNPGAGDGITPGAPKSFDVLCYLAATCSPTDYRIDVPSAGVYVLTTRLPSADTGTGIVTLEGNPVENVPTTSTLEQKLPVANAFMEFLISDSTLVARGSAVDGDVGAGKCDNCHDTLSMHSKKRTMGAGTQNGIVICTVCHNSANTDVANRSGRVTQDGKAEEAIDFKYLIHRIHIGRESTTGFIEVSGGSSQHVFAGEFPPGNRLNNCTNCHVANPTLPLVSGMEGTTVSSGTDKVDHADDLNISPNTAVCSACHDSEGELVHMQVMGGNLSVLEEDILFY